MTGLHERLAAPIIKIALARLEGALLAADIAPADLVTREATYPHKFPTGHVGEQHDIEITIPLKSGDWADVLALAAVIAPEIDAALDADDLFYLGDHVLIEGRVKSLTACVANGIRFLVIVADAKTISEG